jgi:heat shock protein HtpX
MIAALQRLGGISPGSGLPKSMAASGIAGGTMMALFSSHPPIGDRIAALQQRT